MGRAVGPGLVRGVNLVPEVDLRRHCHYQTTDHLIQPQNVEEYPAEELPGHRHRLQNVEEFVGYRSRPQNVEECPEHRHRPQNVEALPAALNVSGGLRVVLGLIGKMQVGC